MYFPFSLIISLREEMFAPLNQQAAPERRFGMYSAVVFSTVAALIVSLLSPCQSEKCSFLTAAAAGLLQGPALVFSCAQPSPSPRRSCPPPRTTRTTCDSMCLQVLTKTALYALFPLKIHSKCFRNRCSPQSTVIHKAGLPS